jgi:hypothetical protein
MLVETFSGRVIRVARGSAKVTTERDIDGGVYTVWARDMLHYWQVVVVTDSSRDAQLVRDSINS